MVAEPASGGSLQDKLQYHNMLCDRRRPRRAAFGACATLLAGGLSLVALSPPAEAAPGAREAAETAATGPSLPDSVVARLPFRDLAVQDVLLSWYRLDPRYRPSGKGLEVRRAFLDQLVEKELLAREAKGEPFVMTREESARYVSYGEDLVRRALYRRVVLDSLAITPEEI